MFKKSSLPYFLGLSFFGALPLHLFVFVTPASAQTPPPSHTYYIHQDHLSSVVTVTDETGSPVKQNKFLAYGKVEASNTSINDKIERGYTGQIKDTHTTLSYYNARYYDPTISRFISADSAGDGMNLYAYVGGNPMNANDPSGNRSRCARGSNCWIRNRSRKTVRTPVIDFSSSMITANSVNFYEYDPEVSAYAASQLDYNAMGQQLRSVFDVVMVPFLVAEDIAPAATQAGVALGTWTCARFIWAGCALQRVALLGASALSLSKGDPADIINASGAGVLTFFASAIFDMGSQSLQYLYYNTRPVGAFAPPRLQPQSAGRTVTAPVSRVTVNAKGQTVIADPSRLPFRSGSVNTVVVDRMTAGPLRSSMFADISRVLTNPNGSLDNVMIADEGRYIVGMSGRAPNAAATVWETLTTDTGREIEVTTKMVAERISALFLRASGQNVKVPWQWMYDLSKASD